MFPHNSLTTPAARMLVPAFLLVACSALVPVTGAAAIAQIGEGFKPVAAFLEEHCMDCHDAETRKGGIDLDALAAGKLGHLSFDTWVKVHDQLTAGEMPPKKKPRPDATRQKAVLETLHASLKAADMAKQARDGRVQYRRLNRVEYENTLRDLLELPHLEVKEMLPADATAHGFDNVGEALTVSYVQMNRYLEAADAALEKAMALGPRPELKTQRQPATEGGRISQVIDKEGVLIGEAVGLLRQPNEAQTPWTWNRITMPVEGMYRVRMKTFGFTWDKGEIRPADRAHVISFYAKEGHARRWLATFDVPREVKDAKVVEFTSFLKPTEQIELYLATLDDRNPKKIRDEYTGPGVAAEWLELEGPLLEDWPPVSHRRLFGDLPVEQWNEGSGLRKPPAPLVATGAGNRAGTKRNEKAARYMVVSKEPEKDAGRLLEDFAARAFRRPLEPGEIEPFTALVKEKIDQKYTFQEAMRVGYKALLCSPDFLFFPEKPGRLDGYRLASRLSYFLWSSLPDEQLLRLGANGKLTDPSILRSQVERMLSDPKAKRFTENFTGQWLDLRKLTVTEPDSQLYPEYDQLLQDSILRETHAYFEEMVRQNLGIGHLVDSDFAMINGRLAEHYGIPGVDGVEIRKVQLPADSVRGGLLTQASVLKITANGTTTSPVIRGAWVLERILGEPVPPPPPNTPAVEPDVRGAVTIRQQLEKHRSVESCASCHRKIDPAGFALESFDVTGGWRERYRALEKGDAVKATVQGRPVKYKLGLPVDASGVAPDGTAFKDIEVFRKILLSDKKQLARGLTEKLLVYGTGAEVSFADRPELEAILTRAESKDYGLRTLIHEIVQSPIFQRK